MVDEQLFEQGRQETMKFLLYGLGVSDQQLEVISKLRTVKELDNLSVDGETQFPISAGGRRKTLNVVLNATIAQKHYTGDKIVALLREYDLTPSVVNDYSHHGPPRGKPLIYLIFSEKVTEDGIAHNVNLYLRKRDS